MSKELAREREIMRTHAVPGKIVREFVIPAKEYAGLTMKEGQTLRFVDIEGKQVPDVVCFNERDLSEELNLGNSLLINKRREFVICGNWAITHRQHDVQDPTHNRDISGNLPEEQQWMDRLFSELGYTDAFRAVNSDPDEFTWWPDGDRDSNGWRVDYQVVSAGLRNTIEYGITYKSQEFGQHAPLIMDYDYEL